MLSALHSLRYRFVFALLGLLIIALVTLVAFTRFTLMPEMLKDESNQAHEALDRAQRAIDNEILHLEMLSKDWASWDDSYQFMRDGNPHFLASNLSDVSIFQDADLSMIAFMKPQGQLYWLSGIDPVDRRPEGCAALDTQCQWARPFLETLRQRIADDPAKEGLTWLQAYPQKALVSVQPILKTDGSGPLKGWLAMIRPISAEWLRKLHNSTGLSIEVQHATDQEQPLKLERLNDQAMRASRLIPAAPKGEQLSIEIDLPRQRLNNRIEAMNLGLSWTLSLMGLLLLLVLWMLERMVLNPLRLFAIFTRQVRRPERTDVPATLLKRRDKIGILARQFQQLLEFQRQQKAELVELSERDPLTGLANRRRFDEHLATSMKMDKRREQSTALVVIDIDHYKAFNDQYGHPAGDACLQALAKVMSAHFNHPEQLIARTGGEEFMAVLPNTSQQSAVDSADRLRAEIEALGIPHSGKVVTISAGVACSTPDTPLSALQLIESGDQALYAAKDSGRNQVIPFEYLDMA